MSELCICGHGRESHPFQSTGIGSSDCVLTLCDCRKYSPKQEQQPTKPKLPDSPGYWWFKHSKPTISENPVPILVSYSGDGQWWCWLMGAMTGWVDVSTAAQEYGEWLGPCRSKDAQLRERILVRIEELEEEPENIRAFGEKCAAEDIVEELRRLLEPEEGK